MGHLLFDELLRSSPRIAASGVLMGHCWDWWTALEGSRCSLDSLAPRDGGYPNKAMFHVGQSSPKWATRVCWDVKLPEGIVHSIATKW